QRLDIGIEQDFVARNLGLVCGHGRQTVEKGEVGKPDQRTCLQAVRDKLAAIDGAKHRNPPEGVTPKRGQEKAAEEDRWRVGTRLRSMLSSCVVSARRLRERAIQALGSAIAFVHALLFVSTVNQKADRAEQ